VLLHRGPMTDERLPLARVSTPMVSAGDQGVGGWFESGKPRPAENERGKNGGPEQQDPNGPSQGRHLTLNGSVKQGLRLARCVMPGTLEP
jgi:hypothetical protein